MLIKEHSLEVGLSTAQWNKRDIGICLQGLLDQNQISRPRCRRIRDLDYGQV